MKRHYFIGDDLNVVAAVERALIAKGIAAEQIHVLSLNDADAEQRNLHDVQSLMKKDVIHSAEIGALIGLAASIAAIAIAHLTGLAAKVGWVPFVFLAIVLLGFFTWEGGLIGIQLPNSRFRRFEKALRAGEHVFFVDVDSAQEPHVEQVLGAHPQLRPAGTGSSSPRWLVGLQQNARRFSQWAP
jgi:hypothetical protein